MASLDSTPSRVRSQAILGLLVANLFWGLSFPLIKALLLVHEQVLPGTSAWFATAMVLAPRFVLATLFLGLWQVLRGQGLGLTRGEIVQGVIIGVFASGGMILQSDGLQFTAASTSAFLTQFYAILIPVYLAWRTRRNPGAVVWISGLLVLVGVGVLGRFDVRALSLGRGEWETLLSSLFFMGQILWLERKEFAGNRPEKLTLVMFATESVILSGMALATWPTGAGVAALAMSIPWWIFTLVLTVVCTIGAYVLMNTWQPKITATEAGLLYCFEPIFGAIMALFLPAWFSLWAAISYPNEQMTWTLIVGGGLITAANVLLQLKSRSAEAK
ncbi:MAG: EamA family transporter [Opitutaceae bacterium]